MKFKIYRIITKSKLYMDLYIIPDEYPAKITYKTIRLFPFTCFVFNDLYIDTRQAKPTH